MIKKLQALRAKKGFTLVELVVVIAIIGVLAAILVPTMLGVVEDSRVTSVDTMANQVKTQTTTWLTNMDAARKGLKMTGKGVISITVDNNGWSVTGPASTSFTNSGAVWSSDSSRQDGTSYANFMADVLRDVKKAKIVVYLEDRAVVGVIACEDSTATIPAIGANNWQSGEFAWGGKKAGIDGDGTIFGTNPKLNYNATASSSN